MSLVNNRDKTIVCKVVYYGPGLGGKTTSLKAVHQVLDPDRKVRLVKLKTDEERTLFFDFLPIELGLSGGYRLKIQAFTVPGQVKYDLTRKYVLMKADAVVFVADSQLERMADNLVSLQNLRDNLVGNRLDPERIPLVFQWNKRDLDTIAPVEELEAKLNWRGADAFATAATAGEGTFEAFSCVVRSMLNEVAETFHLLDHSPSLSDRALNYLERLTQGPRSEG